MLEGGGGTSEGGAGGVGGDGGGDTGGWSWANLERYGMKLDAPEALCGVSEELYKAKAKAVGEKKAGGKREARTGFLNVIFACACLRRGASSGRIDAGLYDAVSCAGLVCVCRVSMSVPVSVLSMYVLSMSVSMSV